MAALVRQSEAAVDSADASRAETPAPPTALPPAGTPGAPRCADPVDEGVESLLDLFEIGALGWILVPAEFDESVVQKVE